MLNLSIHRIWGICLRYLFLFKRSLDRMADAFYWPAIDLILWGLTSAYFSARSDLATSAVTIVATGIVLWLAVWRGQYEITVNILEEIWNRNAVNLFVSPLKFSEWILSFVILGVLKALISLAFAAFLALLLYQVNLFNCGLQLLPFLFLLIMTGWWVGFIVGGLILWFGGKVQQFAWGMVFLIAPFSAIYYPVTVLPLWAQKVSLFVPTSYVFEGARQVMLLGQIDSSKIWVALFLNILYLILSILFFKIGFKKVLNRGLVKLH